MHEKRGIFLDYNSMLRVGVISSTHGVKGEVKVFPTTDDNERFKVLKTCYIDVSGKEEGLLPVNVEGVKFFKNMVILKFKEFNNINDIEKYRNKDILVTREDAVKLNEGEYFVYDLIGSKVMSEGVCIGELSEILATAANDVFVVKANENINDIPSELRGGKEIKKGTEILLPRIPSVVTAIDDKEKIITVTVPKGLI
ncbi:MAG: 16S rRNA processing protein RimM [Lachnospiraceae bacterium]|nr:16S rRNA processing protein RimM [Lachnospiraceae bacterium]